MIKKSLFFVFVESYCVELESSKSAKQKKSCLVMAFEVLVETQIKSNYEKFESKVEFWLMQSTEDHVANTLLKDLIQMVEFWK